MNVSWDVAIPARAELGERPFWDAATGSLMWVDILAGHLLRTRVEGVAGQPAGQFGG